ncbi:hypothetical protein D9758_002762 [Tetrapyrgos nigripes]|uniref:Uncharacterized protein n=1 Tax=Tetrapyrgos nigripes TaxID=182062 RepID=A0A8H5LU08_9AGAR|nr:hypothetical protein D9758_002762 [Tetrapyrgos nigripes]
MTWMISGVGQWDTPLVPGTWYNFAYDIDFNAQTVGLWASTGSNPLQKVVQNKAAPTSTNSEDFHVGVLRIVNTPTPEDWLVSGVYIESGPITTQIGSGSSSGGGGGGSSAPGTTSQPATTISTTSSAPTSTAPTSGTVAQWGQCGGIGWTGATSW